MENHAEAPPLEGVSGGGTGYGWNDPGFRLVRGSDVAAMTTAELVDVWCMPSTATIGHQEPPRPLEQLNLLVARNERESAQVALRPRISWLGGGVAGLVQVHCSDLISSSGNHLHAGNDIRLRRVAPVLGVPDALVPVNMPTFRMALLPGETSCLWLSTDVPVMQPPGVYEGEIVITAVKADAESPDLSHSQRSGLKSSLEVLASKTECDGQAADEMLSEVRLGLHQLLESLSMSSNHGENGSMDIDDDNAAVRIRMNITVWDFVLPITPILPAVFGISETVVQDRFGLEHGSDEWYAALDMHFEWLLQFRISPFFCRWGDNMRILAYSCPWPADHPKADAYYSNPRLAAYAVPYAPVLSKSDSAKDYVTRELQTLSKKPHWDKSYFYLWDEPLSLDQYESIRSMGEKIASIAPSSRILTTYYCGPRDGQYPPGSFEGFVKVPSFLRPFTQIFCTSAWVLGNREDLVKDIISELETDKREEWWTYVCMGPADPHPNWHLGMRGTQHRAVMWRVWKEGSTGFLYWGANCYERALAPAAEVRFRRGLPPGDGVLYYPGQVFNPGSQEPVASVRLERILSGLQDFEYLNLYASRYGRAASLDLLLKTGLYSGPERYTLDHGPVDALRTEIYRTCCSV